MYEKNLQEMSESAYKKIGNMPIFLCSYLYYINLKSKFFYKAGR
jgi:hypothetical protein